MPQILIPKSSLKKINYWIMKKYGETICHWLILLFSEPKQCKIHYQNSFKKNEKYKERKGKIV